MTSFQILKTECIECPKAVKNTIIYTTHEKGFYWKESKYNENFLLFLIKGQIQICSQEYENIILKDGEFILQPICSQIEVHALSESECIYYIFKNPELFCTKRYQYIIEKSNLSFQISPLPIVPALEHYLAASKPYLKQNKICRDLLSLKNKELAFILGNYYTEEELATLLHPLANYTSSFQYFVLENHQKVKTVKEFAQLGKYSITTFQRIFKSVFHQSVYEWMMEQRKENILYDLQHTSMSISEICYKYSFESLPHFSNFCKKKLGAAPRKLRNTPTSLQLPLQEFQVLE